MLEKIILFTTPIADHVAPRVAESSSFTPFAIAFLIGFVFGLIVSACFKKSSTDTADSTEAIKRELLTELTEAVKKELKKEEQEEKENVAKETK